MHIKMGVTTVPMNGGDDACSYMHNSSLQRRGAQKAKELITEAIVEKLDVNHFLTSSSSINIADLGCSVGLNTFITVENIVESVKQKYQSLDHNQEKIQFQVFFNDLVSNDFNTLFKSLPSNRQYSAAGVPGTFHGRLFPKASLHFVNSSYTLQWLSKVPDELADKNSPAFNKGRILYTHASHEVVKAYKAQFSTDIEAFLDARADEVVSGGLMALLLPCVEVCLSHSQSILVGLIDLFGDSLKDMASMGLVNEEKVDSFNFPLYVPTPKELEELINRNGHFRIDKMGRHTFPQTLKIVPTDLLVSHFRAAWEGLIKEHFGSEIIEELFALVAQKFVSSSILTEASNNGDLTCLVVLQRKPTT